MDAGAPPDPTELLGRAGLVDDVTTLLRRERWVTLVGPAGIGKTQLALALRERLSEDPTERGDGTHVCELAGVTSVASLADAVARTLSLEIADAETLGRALANAGRCLLVLDDLDPAVIPPERWLSDAPEARFLVTARRRLGMASEVAVEVGPLEIPRSDAADVVRSSDAVRLLAARGGSPWVEGEPAGAAALVRCLGGNPLAIELVAAHASRFRPSEIAAALLESGRPPTHPLRRTLAWSWALLSPEERRVLARWSVLEATFDEGAARAVGGLEGPLEPLVATSFVRRFVEPRLGDPRLSLYDAVRAFLAERLAPEDRRSAHAALARHYGAVGTRLVVALEQRHTDLDAARRRIEGPNFVAALERGPDVDEAAAAACAALALEPELTTKGRYEDALALADRAVAAASAARDDVLVARATSMRGEVHRRRSLHLARADHASAVTLATAAVPPSLRARSRRCLGVVLRDLGEFDAAEASLLEAAALLESHPAPREVAWTELALAALRRRQGHLALGTEHAERALATAREAGDPLLVGRALVTLGLLHDDAGALERALSLVEEATPMLRGQGDLWTEEIAWNAAGLLHAELGRPDEARACYEEAISICEDAGFDAGLSCVTGNLGWLELSAGRVDRAALRFRQAIARARDVGYHFAEALYGASLGALEAARDRIAEATAAFSAADEAMRACPSPGLEESVTTLCGFLDLAHARRAAGASDPAEAERHLALAQERLARARSRRHADGDLRTAIRALERAVGRALGEAGGAPSPRSLLLATEERTATLGDVRVALGRHPSLWRMLVCLARAIHPVTVDELFAAGWPGERIGRRAARNRVHVGLSTLRRLGLSGVLVSSDEGYRIAPHVECRERSRPADD